MKQPDAFEKMSVKIMSVLPNIIYAKSARDEAHCFNVHMEEWKQELTRLVAKESRRHHAKIERMVRKKLQQPDLYRVTHVLIRDILAELQAMRRGKP